MISKGKILDRYHIVPLCVVYNIVLTNKYDYKIA